MNARGLFVIFAACLGVAGAAPSAAQTGAETDTPALYSDLLRCRTIADERERLRCLEARLDAFEAAKQKREVVVIDRQQIRKTKRTLFGLSLPRLDILDGDKGAASEEIEQVEGTVAGANRDADGRWVVRLADGARWQQIDDRVIGTSPKAGETVVIRRAALGAFTLRIGSKPGFKAKRLS